MRAVHRRLLLAGVVAACLGGAAAFPALAAGDSASLVKVTAAEGTPVPGKYIVTLKAGASTEAAAKAVDAAAVRRFDGVLNGFAARLTGEQLGKLRRDRRVAAIEQDQIVSIDTTQRAPLPWGLDRIDQRSRTRDKRYTYNSSGRGVNAYVIDTGLDVTHPDFGGRASIAWAASRFNGDGRDCNGHGTHVAGTVGAKTYGVAKSVNVRALRVLDCNGEGSMSDVVAAVDWLRTHAAKPAVANLSLGGPKSSALNTAVMNLSKSGVFVSVAAGNSNKDACQFSPSGARWVMTVGATTTYDKRATFSNWGPCVDINAPGYGVYSTWPGGGHKGMTGTSMAAPHVSGVAALYLSTHRTATFPQVQKWLNDNSTHSLSRLRQQANRLLYKGNL